MEEYNNITKTDEHGWLIATSKPIFNKNNEIIGFAAADYLMTDIMAQRNRFWLITGIVLLALALLFSVVAILIVGSVRGVINDHLDVSIVRYGSGLQPLDGYSKGICKF